jgi:uncharacterized membrane protein
VNGLNDFINRNYVVGIVNDTSYNHFDLITYIIILLLGVYAVLKLLKQLNIIVDEEFVLATIPYIFMGSVFRVLEDADLLISPIKYFFITPIIFFVIFVICFGVLLFTRYLENIGKINNYIRYYLFFGIVLSVAGIIILIFNSVQDFKPMILIYGLVPVIAFTGIIQKISPAINMFYLRSRVYSFAIFSYLLDSSTTYIGVNLLGYTNKHPLSSFLSSIFGIIMIPLSLIFAIIIIFMLEKETWNDNSEKFMLILTLIVLGFSMGARNLLAMVFGV